MHFFNYTQFNEKAFNCKHLSIKNIHNSVSFLEDLC